MKPGLVQQTVRGVKCVTWTPGLSVCYNDASYSRTHRKVRYKFERVSVAGKTDKYGVEVPNAARAIRRALKKARIPIDTLLVFKYTILLYQKFPIELK